jgi:hypothetical protein
MHVKALRIMIATHEKTIDSQVDVISNLETKNKALTSRLGQHEADFEWQIGWAIS